MVGKVGQTGADGWTMMGKVKEICRGMGDLMVGKVTGNLSKGRSSLMNEMVDFWMVGEHLGGGDRGDINDAVGGVLQEEIGRGMG